MYHTIYNTQSISTVSTFINTVLSIYNLKNVLTDWSHLKCTHTLTQRILTAASLTRNGQNSYNSNYGSNTDTDTNGLLE